MGQILAITRISPGLSSGLVSYFHYCLRDSENYYTLAGGGFYKKTKLEKTTPEDLKEEEAKFAGSNELFRNAVKHYIHR